MKKPFNFFLDKTGILHNWPKAMVMLAALLLLAGCYYDDEASLYPEATDCHFDTVTYSLDIIPIVNANCAIPGCHVSGTGRVDFTTYKGIKSVADDGRLEQNALVSKIMPPTALSYCDRSKIEAWLQDGAPEN